MNLRLFFSSSLSYSWGSKGYPQKFPDQQDTQVLHEESQVYTGYVRREAWCHFDRISDA
jgi:hypothetical protein